MSDEIVLTAKEAVLEGAKSLRAYGRLFFPKTFRQSSPDFHDEMGDLLYGPSRYNAIEVFRGGAKTTLLRVFTSQRIAYGISRTIMYVGASQAHAVLSIRWLKRQIQYNTKWAQTFGLRKGEKWTDEIIEIYHGVEDTPITVLAVGITGQIRGFNIDDYRPDLIIGDDVCSEENTATPEQRQKLEELFFGALMNSLAPETEAPTAKAVLLQTPFNDYDLIATCLKDPAWNGVRFGCFDDQGRSRWESRFPTETLMKEKQSAIARGLLHLWMREMECKIVSKVGASFNVDQVRYWDVLPEGMWTILAIDPASSDNKDADDQVVGTVGFHGNDVYLLEYEANKGEMPDAAATHFFNQVLKWRPRKAAVESIGFQRTLAWHLKQEMERRRVWVVVDQIQDRRRKADRIIQALSGLLAFGHFYCRPEHTKFLEQLAEYAPTKRMHDDVLDMVAMAITAGAPAMRDDAIDAEFELLRAEEDNYPELEFRGCP